MANPYFSTAMRYIGQYASQISLTCEPASGIEIELPSIPLDGYYPRNRHVLNHTDTRSITQNMFNTYRQLLQRAEFSRCSMLPRFVAWRVADMEGNVLAQSEPFLAIPAANSLHDFGPVKLTMAHDSSPTRSRIDASTLSIGAYRIILRIPFFSSRQVDVCVAAAKLEILATPPIHHMSLLALAATRITDTHHITASLPYRPMHHTLIDRARRNFNRLAKVVAIVSTPFCHCDSICLPIALPDTPIPDTFDSLDSLDYPEQKPANATPHAPQPSTVNHTHQSFHSSFRPHNAPPIRLHQRNSRQPRGSPAILFSELLWYVENFINFAHINQELS